MEIRKKSAAKIHAFWQRKKHQIVPKLDQVKEKKFGDMNLNQADGKIPGLIKTMEEANELVVKLTNIMGSTLV